jgi:HAD superfamily hydrolase (TIGR01509 family)
VTYGLVEAAQTTLCALKDRGYRLGVVTSGSRWRLDPEIRDFGLEGIFDVVVCNEDVRQRKPHPEGILKAAAGLRCETRCCAYVGDVPEDIAAGRNAQTVTVGVKSLFPTSRKLAACGPDLNLERFSDLLAHF